MEGRSSEGSAAGEASSAFSSPCSWGCSAGSGARPGSRRFSACLRGLELTSIPRTVDALTGASARLLLAPALPAAGALTVTLVAAVFPAFAATAAVTGLIVVWHVRLLYRHHPANQHR